MHSKTKNIIVGHTGFVGQNLCEDIAFDYQFNSKNLHDIGECPAACNLYLSCLPATKWKVNQNLIGDIENIYKLLNVLINNTYRNVYLISTIDVYGDSPIKVSETYRPNYGGLSYGSNRLLFESLVDNYLTYENFRIFRLPALYGKNLKKNIIYDLLNHNQVEEINLNSKFQWYDLSDLSMDICNLSHTHPQSKIYNLFPEPVSTLDIVDKFFPNEKCSYGSELIYDYKTDHTVSGYLYSSDVVFEKLWRFLK